MMKIFTIMAAVFKNYYKNKEIINQIFNQL